MVALDVSINHDAAELDLSAMTPVEVVSLRVRAALLRRLGWLQALWDAPEAPPGWFCGILNGDDPAAERVWRQMAATGRHLTGLVELCDEALAGPAGRFRARLARLAGLNAAELDLLDLAVALDAAPALADLAAACGEAGATETLARVLFDHTDPTPISRAGSPLTRWRMLAETGRHALRVDPQIAHFIGGVLSVDALLAPHAEEVDEGAELSCWQLEAEVERILPLLQGGISVHVAVSGRLGDRPERFAAHLARALGLRLLAIGLPRGCDPQTQTEYAIRAERLAMLGDRALWWRGIDWAHYPARPVGTRLILGADTEAAAPGRILHRIHLATPAREDRLRVLAAVPNRGYDADALAARRTATLDDLSAVAGYAPETTAEALRLLNARIAERPSHVGRIAAPIRGWDDLVLPAGTLGALTDIAFEARARIERNGPHPMLNAGMPVLLHGEPGSGKSLAAEVIAGDLGLDMLVVDVASIISKYVGETSKNLRDAFREAADSGALLFFDEADTFFVKRTEVKDTHDKHSNADTNYLLQLIEVHPGVTLLATNRRADIDPAFFRRLRHVVEIPRPGAEERARIWRLNLARVAPGTPLPADLVELLAGFSDLSPAQIEGAVVSAHFAARQAGTGIDGAAIARGIDYELSKEGRALDRRARERLERHTPEETP